MKLTLQRSDAFIHDGWYTIEEAANEDEPLTDAYVEGKSAQMRAIACALRERRDQRFRRVAVRFVDDGVEVWSPRNSQTPRLISVAEADGLAAEIERVLAGEAQP
jgi:hypothetical protein